jgi:hypothetical protein
VFLAYVCFSLIIVVASVGIYFGFVHPLGQEKEGRPKSFRKRWANIFEKARNSSSTDDEMINLNETKHRGSGQSKDAKVDTKSSTTSSSVKSFKPPLSAVHELQTSSSSGKETGDLSSSPVIGGGKVEVAVEHHSLPGAGQSSSAPSTGDVADSN